MAVADKLVAPTSKTPWADRGDYVPRPQRGEAPIDTLEVIGTVIMGLTCTAARF